MQINLITETEVNILKDIYSNHTTLTLQNKGYEEIKQDSLSNECKTKIKEIESILSKAICGFSRFQNFRLNKTSSKLEIRFQYNYNYDDRRVTSFIGVGYILVENLVNGFD